MTRAQKTRDRGARLTELRSEVDTWANSPAVKARVSCSAGCFGCCRAVVPVAPGEAEHVLQALSEEGKARVLRFRGNLVSLCPLLENGRCSVYQDRPLVCRAFHSESAPADCYPEGGDREVVQVLPGPALSKRLGAFWGTGGRRLLVDELKRLLKRSV